MIKEALEAMQEKFFVESHNRKMARQLDTAKLNQICQNIWENPIPGEDWTLPEFKIRNKEDESEDDIY